LGIGRTVPAQREITNHVLGRFSPDEQAIFEQVRDRAVNQLECWLTHGIRRAMNDFNGALNAPATTTSL
jgi:PTH1 family peptidyl-tRNA hydrolase